MKRTHAVVGAISAGVVIVIIVILCVKLPSDYKTTISATATGGHQLPSNEICQTSTCQTLAEEIKFIADESVEPCDNFYKFACGGFIENTQIPDYADQVDMFAMTRYLVEKQLKTLLEKPIADDELEAFKKIKTFYNECLDTDQIEKIGLNVIKSHIESVGGWPALEGDGWNASAFHWPTFLRKFNRMGFDYQPLFTIVVAPDLKNNSRRMIYVDAGKFHSGTAGRADKTVQGYYEFLVEVAVAFGADRETAERDANDALDLEILLAKHKVSSQIRPNITQLYNKRTIADLQKKYPSVPWLECINDVLPEGVSVERWETVIITDTKYFKYLEHLLTVTKKRTLANYLVWHIVSVTAELYTQELADIHLKFLTVVQGVTEMPERWQSCLLYVKLMMGNQASAMYVREYFSAKGKSEVSLIMKYVREEFGKILGENDWMDDETKQVALKKFNAIEEFVAYPEELLDDDYLTKTYGEINIIPGNFFESFGNVKRFNAGFLNKRLRKPVDKNEWITPPISVNAFYKMNNNALVLPAAILQGQFFKHDRPKYMNFGSLGFIIGHEITHGFDDIGRQFDSDGNFKDLWTTNTKKAFQDRVDCFIDQYNDYVVPEVNLRINGEKTQGENIADNGGALEAYRAYQTWQKTNSPELILPGLNYTQNQMFWISLAQVWCNKSRLKKLRANIIRDPHAPYEFRIVGSLSNLKEFADDFNCPPTSPMNPRHKCKLW